MSVFSCNTVCFHFTVILIVPDYVFFFNKIVLYLYIYIIIILCYQYHTLPNVPLNLPLIGIGLTVIVANVLRSAENIYLPICNLSMHILIL